MQWNKLDGWVFDLDGCIWGGDVLLPGAAELVAALRGAGRRVAFLTNNSAHPGSYIAAKLNRLGIPAAPADVITPVDTAGGYLKDRHGSVRVLYGGVPSLGESLAAAGHTVVSDPEAAEAVVMGRDPEWTYAKLAAICRAVERGVPFLALNLDVRLPLENGTWLPGLGTLVASVVTATGRQPEVIGKPSLRLFAAALARTGTTPARSVMIGDTPEADSAGGQAAGMWTVQIGDRAGTPAAHVRVQDPAELLRRWQAAMANV